MSKNEIIFTLFILVFEIGIVQSEKHQWSFAYDNGDVYLVMEAETFELIFDCHMHDVKEEEHITWKPSESTTITGQCLKNYQEITFEDRISLGYLKLKIRFHAEEFNNQFNKDHNVRGDNVHANDAKANNCRQSHWYYLAKISIAESLFNSDCFGRCCSKLDWQQFSVQRAAPLNEVLRCEKKEKAYLLDDDFPKSSHYHRHIKYSISGLKFQAFRTVNQSETLDDPEHICEADLGHRFPVWEMVVLTFFLILPGVSIGIYRAYNGQGYAQKVKDGFSGLGVGLIFNIFAIPILCFCKQKSYKIQCL